MTPTPQFASGRNCQVPDEDRYTCCDLPPLQFAVRRNCQVSRLRDTRYRRRHTRTFHELDPATGHWRRL